MRHGPDRLNRILLALLGLVLLGVGGYGIARSYEAFGARRADAPVIFGDVRDFLSRNADWLWVLAALVALIVAWLGLRWLLAQLRTARVDHLDLSGSGDRGATMVRAGAAASALTDDVSGYPDVRSAKARMVRDGERPEVDLTVDVHEDADVAAVRRRIQDDALGRFRDSLGVEALDAAVHIRLAEPAARRVN